MLSCTLYLVCILVKAAVVCIVQDSIIVRVIVTCITHTISISILLARVGCGHTVVSSALGGTAGQVIVRITITV